MSLPYLPLYGADYLAETAHLSAALSGGYLHLMIHCWRFGRLPQDDAALARITKMTPREWAKAKPTLLGFFDAEFRHPHLDALREKALAKSALRAECGARGGRAKSLKNKNETLAKATVLPEQADGKNVAYQISESSLREDKRAREQAFQEFWARYPHKVGKPMAARAFAKHWRELSAIFAGLDRYVRTKPAHQAWLNPSTFLNQRRWEDEPCAVSGAGPPRRSDALAQELADIYRQEAEDGERYGAEAQGDSGNVLRLAEPPMVGREDGHYCRGVSAGHDERLDGRAE